MARFRQYPQQALTPLPESLQPETVFPDKWYQPLAEPVRVLAISVALIASSGMAAIDAQALTQPEEPRLDKWHIALSEPVRVPPRLTAAHLPAVFDTTDIWPAPPAPEPDYGWFQALAEPIFLPLPRLHAGPVDDANTWPAPPPTVPDYGWFEPLAEPQQPPRVHPARLPWLWHDPQALTQPEPTTPDRWFQPLAEPVLPRPPFAHQLGGAFDTTDIWPAAEAVTLDKWWAALSEPVLPARSFAFLMAGAFDDVSIWPAPTVVLPGPGTSPLAATAAPSSSLDRRRTLGYPHRRRPQRRAG